MTKRDKLVAIYLSEEEKQQLQKLAAAEERTLGAFLRRIILSATKINPTQGADEKGKGK
jgi:predicted DNA-binding protein